MPNRPFTINVTYDPSTGALTCNPPTVNVPKTTTGIITVNLGLSAGATGSIVFGDPPFNWSSSPPPNTTIAPPNVGGNKKIITDPNNNRSTESYVFTVNYTYTPSGGSPVNGTGDPTIVNEGTGSDGDG